jgi:hypothetical protein
MTLFGAYPIDFFNEWFTEPIVITDPSVAGVIEALNRHPLADDQTAQDYVMPTRRCRECPSRFRIYAAASGGRAADYRGTKIRSRSRYSPYFKPNSRSATSAATRSRYTALRSNCCLSASVRMGSFPGFQASSNVACSEVAPSSFRLSVSNTQPSRWHHSQSVRSSTSWGKPVSESNANSVPSSARISSRPERSRRLTIRR